MHGTLDRAEHDRDVRPQPERVSDAVGLEPLVGGHLVATDHLAHFVVEDLGCRPRQRLEADRHQPPQVVGQRLTQALGPFGDLEGREPVHVDVRRRVLHGPAHVDVVVAVEARVDAAL